MKTVVNISYFRSTRVWRSLTAMNLKKIFSFDEREANFTHFRSTRLSWSLSTMDLQKTECVEEREGKIDSLWSTRVCRSLSTIDLTNGKFNSRRDKWPWLTLIDVSLKIIDEYESRKYRFIREERSEFYWLSIAESVEIVVERGSRKDRYFVEETETWILLTLHRQDCPIHHESGFRKNRDLVKGEGSEFHSLSIGRIFRIISTIDLEKTESVEEREGNLSHFHRQVFAHHWRRWI